MKRRSGRPCGGCLSHAAYRFSGLTSTVVDRERDYAPGQAGAIGRGSAEALFPRLAR
ncbi:hypothetical protein JBE04_07110 [Streptomyces sp. PRKS01-29]|nr:hypothetical protein [Streptomyces sabulosicollis]MBI0294254.1 hypothetical protein [Streptomyces sabulosicollis]